MSFTDKLQEVRKVTPKVSYVAKVKECVETAILKDPFNKEWKAFVRVKRKDYIAIPLILKELRLNKDLTPPGFNTESVETLKAYSKSFGTHVFIQIGVKEP